MGRGVKSTKGKAEATRAPAGTSPKDEGAKVRDLEKRLAEALQREQVLVEQQTATAEILSVISSSPTDVQPVFDTITQNALELCGAASSLLTTFDGELLHLAALANVRPGVADSLRRVYPMRPGRGAARSRAGPGLPERPRRADAAGGEADRHHQCSQGRPGALLREPDRPAPDLRRPGRYRDRKRPPLQGAGGAQHRADHIAGHADRHQRHPASDLECANGFPAGLRRDRAQRPQTL